MINLVSQSIEPKKKQRFIKNNNTKMHKVKRLYYGNDSFSTSDQKKSVISLQYVFVYLQDII